MEFNRKKIDNTYEIDVNLKIENNQVTAEDYFQLGEINLKKSDLNVALLDFSKAIELNSTYALAYFKRGVIYHNKKLLQNALNEYSKAILLAPNIEDIFYYRGCIYLDLNNFRAAIDDYTTALQAKKNDSKTFFYRGLSHEKIGDINFAIFDYSKAIEFNPNMESAYFNRGKIFLNQNKSTDAQNDFNIVCNLNENRRQECNNLLLLFQKRLELEKQAQLNEIARQKTMIVVNQTLQKANTFFTNNQYQQAIFHYTEVIKLNSGVAEAYFKRGQCYWYLNKKDNAMKDFDQATALDSKYGKLLLGLGIAGLAGNLLNKFLKK